VAKKEIPLYGGQAVIEGVMMRGRHYMAVAMRAPSGEIVTHSEKLGPIYASKWARVPFVRGLVLLWDALGLGARVLALSANTQTGEDEEKLEGLPLAMTMAASLGFAVLLFFIAPAGIGHWVEDALNLAPLASALFEGVVRLAILVGYLVVIARMDEIRRVYGYHGAEHKTINAFEAGAELTPETVDKYPIEHPRCGTAFLLTVVVFSILVFASIAYEYLRLTARYIRNPLVRVLVAPNLALQRLTTRPPDKGMLEVGIAAFKEMKKLEDEAIARAAS
jgi:uncharacterized protein YqhQ